MIKKWPYLEHLEITDHREWGCSEMSLGRAQDWALECEEGIEQKEESQENMLGQV